MNHQTEENATRCRIIVFLVALGFVVAASYHYWRSVYRSKAYPISTYLFRPDDRYQKGMDLPLGSTHIFGDLLFVSRVMRNADPYHFQPETGLPGPSNYPPFMHIVTWFFHFMPFRAAVPLFIALTLAIAGAFFWYFFCRSNGLEALPQVLILTTMCYPVQFILDRGNVEILAFAFVALFCFYYFKGKHDIAGFWLGLAAAAKIFPGAYGLIFLAERKWKAGFTFLLTGLAATLVSGMLLNGGLRGTLTAYPAALKEYANFYDGWQGYIFGWGMHGAAVCIVAIVHGYPDPRSLIGRLDRFFDLAAMLPATALMFAGVLIRGLKQWERLMLFGVLVAFAPVPNPDYRLILLLVPMAAFLNKSDDLATDSSDASRRSGRITAVLFALILMPWGYLATPAGFHEGVILRPAILLIICYRILRPYLFRRREQKTLLVPSEPIRAAIAA